jgi:S-adenosylmethionine:tRNA ribosyltransferase-isomerase
MHPKHLSIKDFTYELPDEKVAKYPLPERDDSKLLVYDQGVIWDSQYFQLPAYIPENSMLIFNNTKVVEARIFFQKDTGGVIEIFCLEPLATGDITMAMMQKGNTLWKCLVGGASKWKHGTTLKKIIEQGPQKIVLEAAIKERLNDCFVIEFTWQPADMAFAEVLHQAGVIPLPPYLHRNADETDKTRYQTLYATHEGSVAAPTAGLHFTRRLFSALSDKNIAIEFVTLHVGAGTFMPVKAEIIADHEMHTEFIDVDIELIEKILSCQDNRIVAVGTTSLRTLESLYWMGVKVLTNAGISAENIWVKQWEPYETKVEISVTDALQGLMSWMNNNQINRLLTSTQIMIAPGYDLKIASGLITNFHQPQSTLLLLIAAITGNDWKRIYQHAMQNDYRFLSYGDGCLLWKKRVD